MALSASCKSVGVVKVTSTSRASCPAVVRRVQSSRPAVVVNAVKDDNSACASPLSMIPAALAAACLMCSAVAPAAVYAVGADEEMGTAGSELTKNLIKSGGTPEAAVPKTNVPFQAPGINKPTRNAPQEQGTNLKRALKGAGEQIKQNYKDPDAAPFGVGKGPLVRDAKRMNQPSFTRSFGKGPSQVYKQQASSSRPIESVKEDPSKVLDNRGVWYPLIEKSAGKS